MSDVIGQMVQRFLSWPLPEDVCADAVACQQGAPHRTGTNLLTAAQARQMIEHVCAAALAAKDAEIAHLQERYTAVVKQENEHCKDCCCARSWRALGVSEYTGKSIPEHIAELKDRAERAEAERDEAQQRDSEKMYQRCSEQNEKLRDERDALRALLKDAREGVDMIGCSPEGYDSLIKYRDDLLSRIDEALLSSAEDVSPEIAQLRRDARIGQLVRRRLAEGLVATITPHEVHDIDAEGGVNTSVGDVE